MTLATRIEIFNTVYRLYYRVTAGVTPSRRDLVPLHVSILDSPVGVGETHARETIQVACFWA